MRFNLIILFLMMCLLGCGKWFGEKRPTPPEYKFQYTKNDSFTVESFRIISNNFDDYVMGRMEQTGFIKAVNRSMALLDMGTSRLEGKNKDAYTQEEIQFILTSGILDESQQIKVWIRRFVALINILLGDEYSDLQLKDVRDIFRRVVLTAPYMIAISDHQHELILLDLTQDKDREKYWLTQKNIFANVIKMAKVLFQNDRGRVQFPLIKRVILNQYPYLDEGINRDYWDRFIEAGFLMNRVILGKTDQSISPQDILSLFDMIDFTYEKIFDVYQISERKIWTTEEFSSILYHYHTLIYYFLNQFCMNSASKIESKDLERLFKLLHLGTKSEATVFVNAILDLKALILKSDDRVFSREDIRKLRDFVQVTIDKVQDLNLTQVSQNPAMVEKVKPLWSSPFAQRKDVATSDLKLSLILLSVIDRVISVYDTNNDQRLSFSTSNEKELTALLAAAKKFVAGFHELLGNPNAINSMASLGEETLGNVIIGATDHLLLNGNKDGELDRYEILEVVSYFIENERFVSSHFWSDAMAPYRHEDSEKKIMVLDREQWLSHFGEDPMLCDYFPRLSQYFSSSQTLRQYMNPIVNLFRRDGDSLQLSDLKLIFSLVRFVEQLFLKYDLNGSNVLERDEILNMFPDFQPLIQRAYDYYKEKNPVSAMDVVKSIFSSDSKVGFWDGVNYMTSGSETIQKRIFFYALTHGFFPTSYPDDPKDQPIQWSSRKDIMRLIRRASLEFEMPASNAPQK